MSKPLSAVEFAEAIITHWPPFRWDEHQETSWTQALVREIGGFEKEVLGKALAALIRTRRDTKTPTVAVCIDACVSERRYLEAQKVVETLPVDAQKAAGKWPSYVAQRDPNIDVLVKSPLGRQAAKEGWIGAMYAFAMEHRRLPLDNAHVPAPKGLSSNDPRHPIQPYVGMTEIAMCKQQAKDFDEAYAMCVRGGDVIDDAADSPMQGMRKSLARLQGKQWESTGAAMLKNRNELADMVLQAR